MPPSSLGARPLSDYRYQPDEDPKKKHHWSNNYYGFVPHFRGADRRRVLVGKCPNSISTDLAAEILHRGVPLYNRRAGADPDRIYSVHDGVVYEARPTMRGRSYHGYPALPQDLRGPDGIPKPVLDEILKLARQLNQFDQVTSYIASDPDVEDVP